MVTATYLNFYFVARQSLTSTTQLSLQSSTLILILKMIQMDT